MLGKPLLHGPIRWEWIVAISCFWINMCLFGAFRSSGLLYVALVDTYHCTHAYAAWSTALSSAIMNLSGPLVGLLTHLLTIRVIILIGSVVSSSAVTLCYFATDIKHVILLLGGLQGLGLGLVTNLTPVIISHYFQEHKATACAISYSGSTVGTFFFPFIIAIFLDERGLKDTFSILGSIMFCSVLGAVFLRLATLNKDSSRNIDDLREVCSHEDAERVVKKRETSLSDSLETQVIPEPLTSSSLKVDPKNRITVKSKASGQFQRSTVFVIVESTNFVRKPFININSFVKDQVPCSLKDGSVDVKTTDLNSVKRLSVSLANDFERHLSGEQDTSRFCPPKYVPPFNSVLHKLNEALNKYMNPHLSFLFNYYFILLSVSSVSFVVTFWSILTVLPDHARDQNIGTRHAAFLISSLSITDIVGKFIPSVLQYFKLADHRTVLSVSLALLGFLSLLLPIPNQSFYSLLAISLGFGGVSGSLQILIPVLISDYFGPDQTAVVFGFSNFFNGLATLGRPAMIGHFKDIAGDYNGLFYTLGGFSVVSAALWTVELVVQRKKLLKELT
ncbi:monocarboxylate transporter 12-like [Tachypleus tridentatus]|uniref:monocarboxylate transporter 12-like n=1 Tax=Tachypleus tridentatus TaxID=6853 RepID=UPI003FD67C6E